MWQSLSCDVKKKCTAKVACSFCLWSTGPFQTPLGSVGWDLISWPVIFSSETSKFRIPSSHCSGPIAHWIFDISMVGWVLIIPNICHRHQIFSHVKCEDQLVLSWFMLFCPEICIRCFVVKTILSRFTRFSVEKCYLKILSVEKKGQISGMS